MNSLSHGFQDEIHRVIPKLKPSKACTGTAFRTYSLINTPYDDEYESFTINISLSPGRSYSHHEDHMFQIKSLTGS